MQPVPELPDVVVYVETLMARIGGRVLEQVHLRSPFVLRSVDPPIDAITGRTVKGVRRLGKRLVLAFDEDLFLVIHLMIAGRLRWRDAGRVLGMGPKIVQASFVFDSGTLFLTEAGSKKRASIRLASGEAALAALDPGGVEPLDVDRDGFHKALTRENHTLKRALTDPHIFSGIGNAYSDEILHAARLSPLNLTRALADDEVTRLYDATRATLLVWIDHLRREAAGGIPEKVTAFHDAMAVHGRFRQPCPVCGAPIQRIVYATNECNYCAVCQTGGRRLADRALSRLLGEDWPRTLDDR
jgi:formamidopyrimidine-DNA glycosylase